MSWKVWIMSGILLMLAGAFGVFWGIFKAFYVLGHTQHEGIGAVGNAIQSALFSYILVFGGFVPLIIGFIKLVKKNKSKI